MPQLTKGARKALDQAAALAADMHADLGLAHNRVKFNPEFAQDKITDARNALDHLLRVLREDIEPLLERQAPEYERRLQELEARVAELEDTRLVLPARTPR